MDIYLVLADHANHGLVVLLDHAVGGLVVVEVGVAGLGVCGQLVNVTLNINHQSHHQSSSGARLGQLIIGTRTTFTQH